MEYKVGQEPSAYQTVSEPVLTIAEEPSEIMHGVINGLAATISLWIFWVPFIIFIGRPLINAQIKEQVCGTELFDIVYKKYSFGREYNEFLWNTVAKLIAEGKITEQEGEKIREKYGWNPNAPSEVPPDVQHTLDINPQKNWDDNFGLITIFSIALASVLVGCVFLILAACAVSGIDPYHVLKFNLLMTLIIVVIECSFFGAVTMRYMPYNLNAILAQSEQKILGFFN